MNSFSIWKIAKAEKLKPLEVELKKLEDLSESIVNDFAYMRAREEEMRDTNGKLVLIADKIVRRDIVLMLVSVWPSILFVHFYLSKVILS